MATLETLTFDNRYTRLAPALFARVPPEGLPAPRLVAFNPDAAELIDLDASEAARPDFAAHFGGVRVPPGADPIAMRYAGHQFGVYVPQLGDGRALLYGEVVNASGAHWDLQVKGSGRTPFSRGGDGRAVLRSTIREYLCSEAMHGLGIPTTRALCIVGSDAPVQRERLESAAVLTRLSPSHVRFGSFEMFAHIHKPELVRELADHVITCHFGAADWARGQDRYTHLLREVVRRTAHLVAAWQAVGFAHGVMNTDNMSILGLTLDYGPFGFLDAYDPSFICNHSDDGGRYSFERQPRVALWNLSCLAYAFLGLVAEDAARAALDAFEADFLDAATGHMQQKLGLATWRGEDDATLAATLLRVMRDARVDHTNFWRALAELSSAPDASDDAFAAQLEDPRAFRSWASFYRERLRAEGSVDAERRVRMRRANPAYVLRNHLAQQAIERAEAGDFAEIERLRTLLADPFEERPGYEAYASPPPASRRHLAVSCSS